MPEKYVLLHEDAEKNVRCSTILFRLSTSFLVVSIIGECIVQYYVDEFNNNCAGTPVVLEPDYCVDLENSAVTNRKYANVCWILFCISTLISVVVKCNEAR